jgi:hypothetical protein
MGTSSPWLSEDETSKQQEREKARERENEELKDRIKTLEQGWDAVVKALAAQGVSAGIPASKSSADLVPEQSPPSPSSETSSYHALIPTSSIFPVSPAPSQTSLSGSSILSDEQDSTRHLARVAITGATPPSVSLQRVVSKRLRLALSLRILLNRRSSTKQTRRTTRPWKTSSAKFSLLPPLCRRRVSLRTRPCPPSLDSRRRPPPRQ